MEIKPVNQLDGNRTKIVCNDRFLFNKRERYFDIPNDKKDEFVSDFQKSNKKNSVKRWVSYLGASIAGAFLGAKVSKNYWLSLAGMCAGTFIFGRTALSINEQFVNKNENELFDKYNVKQ